MVTSAGPADAVLWQAAAAGEHDAFGQLFDRHANAVYNYLLRRTADWSVAEDLTAAVFLHAWRRRGDVIFDGDSALPWLLGVARQLVRNAARSRHRYLAAIGRAGREAMAGADRADRADRADPADLVTGRLDTEQQLLRLRTAIGRLPRQQQEVIELCVYAGLDQQAAAIALGVSVGTIKSRLHRARQRLAAELQPAPQAGPMAPGREEL
jgi:RNA polymerase sigma factor (sigma-70 family)